MDKTSLTLCLLILSLSIIIGSVIISQRKTVIINQYNLPQTPSQFLETDNGIVYFYSFDTQTTMCWKRLPYSVEQDI